MILQRLSLLSEEHEDVVLKNNVRKNLIDQALKNAKLLIVDDQQANLDVITGLLDIKGYTKYITTNDPRQVLRLYEEYKPDLILLDLNMPYLTGFQVMTQLRSIIPAYTYLPMLVLTADITSESRQKALAQGASDFLTKPFDLIEVELRINNLLRTCFLYRKLENLNQFLEERVKERTKELEKTNIELIAAKERAEQSDKLKSEFLNQMSHEIRSPMNAVLNYSDLLKQELLEYLTPDLFEYFKGIDSAGRQLIRTVDLIMNVSEMQIGAYKPDDSCFDLLKVVIDKIKAENKIITEEKGIHFNCSTSLSEAMVVGDQYSINQIFVNLIDNSIKYTKKGGITIYITKNEPGIKVSIEDTGVGMSEEFMKTMYNPFVQEEKGNTRKYDGNGLGLALVKKYCDLNRISIEVESEKNAGTKFTLLFTRLK
jgi:two-component system, sensor histidine kinase and response regulator